MKELKTFIEDMRGTSSATDKIAIITRSSAFIHKVLEATYNPYKQYNVTGKTCKKNNDLLDKTVFDFMDGDIFKLLNSLTRREFTGHKAIGVINGFVDYNGQIIYKIIDKDLDIRVGAKIINKAIPGLIPTFNVALAQSYEGKCDWNNTWYASRKLDGVRCLAVVDDEGRCTLYSRMGKEFTTLNKIKDAIEATNIYNTVFDGEICLMDEDGDEDFQSVMKELRRKDHQIENPVFMIFDMLHKPDFDKGKSTEILSERLHKLRTFIDYNLEGTDFGHEELQANHTWNTTDILRNLDQYVITDGRHFDTWAQMATDNNWEGFMLRKDIGYEGKRSKNLLKVKKFFDAEYKVIKSAFGPMAVVRDGKEAQEMMLAQVYIEHKGHVVAVGSGFSQEQRIKYWKDEDIVGKIITVQYFEETKNDKGGISLRFPTVKIVHGEKREL